MSVEWTRLGDLTEMKRVPVVLNPGETYRRIGIYSWAKGFLHRPAADIDEMGSMRYFTFPEGALVVSNIQAWEGAVAVSGETEHGHVCSNRFLPYVPGPEIDVKYLFHYLASDSGLDLLRKASPGTTVRNRTLSRSAFEDSRIPLPDLPTQRRIAARLDAISDTSSAVPKTTKKTLDAIRNQITQGAFADASRHPIHELVELERDGISIDPDAIYRPIGVRSFGRGLIRYEETKGADLSKLAYFSLPPSALVVSNIKAWEGAVAYSGEDVGLVTSSRFLAYLPTSEDVLTKYLLAYFRTNEGVEALSQASPGSADRNRTLGRKRFEAIEVPVPDLPDQLRLLERLSLVDQIEATMTRRAILRDALLPAARNEEFSRLISA